MIDPWDEPNARPLLVLPPPPPVTRNRATTIIVLLGLVMLIAGVSFGYGWAMATDLCTAVTP